MNFKSRIYLLGVLSTLLVIVSCATSREMKVEVEKMEYEVMVRDILTGDGSEGIEQGLVVCNAQEELDLLKNKMNSINYSTKKLDEYTID